MSRPIKFRVWTGASMISHDDVLIDPNGKCYIRDEDYILDDDCNEIPIESIRKAPNWTPLQFTGLTDADGNEIYEGDVVKHLTLEEDQYPTVGAVVYSDRYAAFCWDRGDEIDNLNESGGFATEDNVLPTFRVIGNIYENPELIDG